VKTALLLASALVLVGGSIEVDAKPRAKRAKVRPAKKAKKAKKPPKVTPAPEVEVAPTPAPEPEPVVVVAPPVEPTPAPVTETVETVEPASAEAEVTVAVEPAPRVRRVRISVDDGPVMRQLRYVDDWATDGNTVRDYDLVANAIGVSVAARPLLAVPAELYARGELVIGVSGSQGPDDEVYSTRSSEIQLGALLGGTLGRVNAGIAIAAGQHSFTIADEMSTRGELVPDTRYRYVRLGGAVGVPLGSRVNVTADAGYRMLTTSGDLASTTWFPWATGDGVDASLGVDVRVTQTIHAYVRGSVRRYFFAMNPEPGDALVVGGAIDQYLGLAAGLGFAIH
jgi:hypothetical protein